MSFLARVSFPGPCGLARVAAPFSAVNEATLEIFLGSLRNGPPLPDCAPSIHSEVTKMCLPPLNMTVVEFLVKDRKAKETCPAGESGVGTSGLPYSQPDPLIQKLGHSEEPVRKCQSSKLRVKERDAQICCQRPHLNCDRQLNSDSA